MYSLNRQNNIFRSEKNFMYTTTYLVFKFVFSYKQDEWECNLKLS